MIAALLPMWPRLERTKLRTGVKRGRVGIAAECPDKEDKHKWMKGRAHWTCVKCMSQTKTRKLTKRREHQRCFGREDCLAEDAVKYGHKLWETTCGKEQIIFCRACGAWTENVPVKLKSKCKGLDSAAGAVSLRRLINEEVHPKWRIDLDQEPRPYLFNENEHGPSRHTTRVRRQVRRLLNRIDPWEEEAGSAPSSGSGGDEAKEGEAVRSEGMPEDPWEEMQRFYVQEATAEQVEDPFGFLSLGFDEGGDWHPETGAIAGKSQGAPNEEKANGVRAQDTQEKDEPAKDKGLFNWVFNEQICDRANKAKAQKRQRRMKAPRLL